MVRHLRNRDFTRLRGPGDAAGIVQGIRYDELAPLLLNDLQLQGRKLASQDKLIAEQGRQLRDIARQLNAVRRAAPASPKDLQD